MSFDPYRPPTTDCAGAAQVVVPGIRKFCGVFLAIFIVLFCWYANTGEIPHGASGAFGLFWQVVDITVIFFMSGYVLRWPIRQQAVGLLVIGLALGMWARTAWLFFMTGQYLFPWDGGLPQRVILLTICIGTLYLLPAGVFLWRYGTQPQRQRIPSN